jgi:hypothetical protein
MKKLEYNIFGAVGSKFTLEILDEHKELDYFASLQAMGYEKCRICSPYHYVESSDPCVEIVKFYRENHGSILELWDHNGCIYNFYCRDESDELELMAKFISMANHLIGIEYMNRQIYKEEGV